MIRNMEFKTWLRSATNYTDASIADVVCRMNRVDKILEWQPKKSYLYLLEQTDEFSQMSISVKSQARAAVKKYLSFIQEKYPNEIVQ